MIRTFGMLSNAGDLRWQQVLCSGMWRFPFWRGVVVRILTQVTKIMNTKLLSRWINLLNYPHWRSFWELVVECMKQRTDICILHLRVLACSLILSAFFAYAPVLIIGFLTILI